MRPLKFSSASKRSTALTSETCEELLAQAGLRRVGLDLAADRFRPGSSLAEVGIDLGTVPEVVGDDCVDVIELKDREVLSYLFG